MSNIINRFGNLTISVSYFSLNHASDLQGNIRSFRGVCPWKRGRGCLEEVVMGWDLVEVRVYASSSNFHGKQDTDICGWNGRSGIPCVVGIWVGAGVLC